MDGEQESIAALEPETTIEPEVEPNEPETPEGEEPEGLPVDDDEEFDWNGKKVKGPKGLKDGVLMHADYTRKTQEVSAKAKELETRAAAIDQQFKASDEELNARGAMISLDAALKSYENVDWDAWEAQDLFAAQAGFRKLQELKEQKGQVAQYLDQRKNERSVQEQQSVAKRLQETREYAEKQIKGWSPDVDAKVTEFATKELGFDWNTLKSAYTPAVYRALHLAWLGHQAINAKPITAPKTPVEPLKVVAAKANPPASKSLKDMSMDEYVAHRNKQMAGKR